MPIMETDVEVFCDTCGRGLCGLSRIECHDVHVKVCPNCIAEVEEKIRRKYLEEIEELNNKLYMLGG